MSEDFYRLALPDVDSDFLWAGETSVEQPRTSCSFAVFLYAVIFIDLVVMSGITAIYADVGVGAPAAILFMLLVLVLFFNRNLYKIEVVQDFGKAWPQLVAAWVIAGVVAAGVMLMTQGGKASIDYHSCLVAYASGLGVVMGERLGMTLLFRYLVRRGVITHIVAIIGAPDLARRFSRELANNRFGVRVVMIFDDQAAGSNAVDMLMAYEKSNRIDTIVITHPMDNSERLRTLVYRLTLLPTNIRILSGDLAMEMKTRRYAPHGEIPGVRLVTVSDRPIDEWGGVAKFLLDRGVALLALLFFGPVMLLCVAGIKLSSPGPVLFRQKRIGYKNEIFEVYKFRSMHRHACNTGKLTERNDARIFKFGHIMRKLSLDELPQIFNVLRGDMSLVGPRPHMPEACAAGQFYFDCVSAYALRHRVKPGITGWAQVCGWRGPTETVEQIEKRVAHDLFYIDNWSFGFDLLILIKTLFVGFAGKNAF